MVYGNMRNVIQGKTCYFITDIINGLICTLKSFLQHILHCLESQQSLHISFGSSQGYGHLFRLELSSVDKSLR